ncbi:MAG: GyrI-like domain-containing protein [Acholeplasmataceae bacterium]|nr:GyrI-like domain-containing protein [Acholeplasmataceae bacterium]
MKYEWRKNDKALYIPKTDPQILTIKSYPYIKISGKGNPNSQSFQKDIEVLYALSYGLKMAPKQKIDIKGYFEYVVFPLEGIWSLTKEGINLFNQGQSIISLKDHFSYELMIRQPDFLTKDLFEFIKMRVHQKKANDNLLNAEFFISDEKLICQALHIGSFDDEPKSFKKMEDYAQSLGYTRASKDHTEIYISDPRKTSVDKLKTTLRFEIIKNIH